MASETRANIIVFLGVSTLIYQNVDAFDMFELLMTCLSCITVFLYSLISLRLGNESIYRISENGLTCCLFLPLINIVTCISTGNRLASSLFQNGLILTSLVPFALGLVQAGRCRVKRVAGYAFIISLLCWVVFLFVRIDILISACICLLLLIQLWLQNRIPNFFPKSFTLGELSILCQACVILLLNFLLMVIPPTLLSFETCSEVRSPTKELLMFSQIVYMSCVIFILMFATVRWFRHDCLRSFLLLIIGFLFFTWPVFNTCISKDFFYWFLQTISEYCNHTGLLIHWFICVTIAVVISILYQPKNPESKERLEKTKIRKVFHLLISLVYLPGLLSQPAILFLASIVALVLLVLLEIFRYYDVPPIGQPIRNTYTVFLDDQDKGSVVLTPIYLLIGCSSSLWLSIGQQFPKIMSMAGLISLGVGDSVASYIGSKYGRHYWKDSPKTIEGTLASIIAQLVFVATLEILGFHILHVEVLSTWKVLYVITLTSLLEAFTFQIDNLTLPLFMYLLLL